MHCWLVGFLTSISSWPTTCSCENDDSVYWFFASFDFLVAQPDYIVHALAMVAHKGRIQLTILRET